jgi:hypothetical protein
MKALRDLLDRWELLERVLVSNQPHRQVTIRGQPTLRSPRRAARD